MRDERQGRPPGQESWDPSSQPQPVRVAARKPVPPAANKEPPNGLALLLPEGMASTGAMRGHPSRSPASRQTRTHARTCGQPQAVRRPQEEPIPNPP